MVSGSSSFCDGAVPPDSIRANICSNKIRSCAACWSSRTSPRSDSSTTYSLPMTPTSRSGTLNSGMAAGRECEMADGSGRVAGEDGGGAWRMDSPVRLPQVAGGAKPVFNGGCGVRGISAVQRPAPVQFFRKMRQSRRGNFRCGWKFRLLDGLGFGLWDLGLDFRRMESQQRLLHRLGDQFPDFKFAVKFHLAFGRMDVHVHGGGINFQKQAADRVAAFHQRGVIALEQRVVEAAIFDRAAVDEQMLALARRARNARARR